MNVFRWGLVILLLLTGCARAPVKTAFEAMRPTSMPETLADDIAYQGLKEALTHNIQVLEAQKDTGDLVFGPRTVSRGAYLAALKSLLKSLEQDPSGSAFAQNLKENFEAFEVYGRDRWGEVFMTSYFEPVIKGALKPTGTLTEPLYSKPTDLVDIDFEAYLPTRTVFAPLMELPADQKVKMLRGRLLTDKERNIKIVPYPTRSEIYSLGLKDVAKPLLYVDPIDAFVLEVQGSGVVEVGRKTFIMTYAGQNGHAYVSIGKTLFDVIPKEKMTLFSLESHLRSLPLTEARRLMELNPSYVFFKEAKSRGRTYMGAELADGRTVATDAILFPKGALAWLRFERPEFPDPAATEPTAWTPSSRFVLDQDTGGAIRGPGRLDLFAGRGPTAKQMAAVMKNKGQLIYFVPKAAAAQPVKPL